MIEPKLLPYDYAALEPFMSAATLRFHHDGHYVRYVRRVNELSKGAFGSGEDAYEYALATGSKELREQAAQVVAHEAFFQSMSPFSAANPHWDPHLRKEIRRGFGRALEERWIEAAMGIFGSGYVYLLVPPGRPLTLWAEQGGFLPSVPAVLVMDVWEHAYYLDHPDDKVTYVHSWLRNLADWSRVTNAVIRARAEGFP